MPRGDSAASGTTVQAAVLASAVVSGQRTVGGLLLRCPTAKGRHVAESNALRRWRERPTCTGATRAISIVALAISILARSNSSSTRRVNWSLISRIPCSGTTKRTARSSQLSVSRQNTRGVCISSDTPYCCCTASRAALAAAVSATAALAASRRMRSARSRSRGEERGEHHGRSSVTSKESTRWHGHSGHTTSCRLAPTKRRRAPMRTSRGA